MLANEKLPLGGTNKNPAELALRRTQTLDVLGFQTFVAGDDVEGDLFSFVQGFKASPGNGRMMHENVLPAALGDEAKPLFIVKPLNFAAGHNCS
ncbi:MAG TPA: hypothetical protein VK815_12795 [Candidatus Acidoferrales bacterium]|nr:hypothetical protein [Candidatus Acidoferrales bacterium]